jgi:hypothetical protein
MEQYIETFTSNEKMYKPGEFSLSVLMDSLKDFFSSDPADFETDCKFVYHKTVGFPDTIIIPNRIFNLGYTNHARNRAKQRVKGAFAVLPTFVRLTNENLIEIHTDDNKFIKKAVVKLHYDKTRDIVLVLDIKFPQKKAVVVTLYYNLKNHSFDTLDKTKYNKP